MSSKAKVLDILSDESSNEYIPSLAERLKFAQTNEKKSLKISTIKRAPTHALSDSDESLSESQHANPHANIEFLSNAHLNGFNSHSLLDKIKVLTPPLINLSSSDEECEDRNPSQFSYTEKKSHYLDVPTIPIKFSSDESLSNSQQKSSLISSSSEFSSSGEYNKESISKNKRKTTQSSSEEQIDNEILENPKKPRKQAKAKVIDLEKEARKEQRLKEREERKKEKELDRALKAAEKEQKKNSKPEECMKNMKMVLDDNIKNINDNQELIKILDDGTFQYIFEENAICLSVLWYRNIINIQVENKQVFKQENQQLENVLVLIIPNKDFVQLVHSSFQKGKGKQTSDLTLLEYLSNIKEMFIEMEITCVTIGLEKYIRETKCGSDDSLDKKIAKKVSKTVINEVEINVQLNMRINFKHLNNAKEYGELLLRFTKAIAEAPLKKEKYEQKSQAFSWYADGDSSCPVKIAKDGSGAINLWRQQIQQFNNVGKEIAEAIVSKYPSPRLLINAYKACSSEIEAQNLLQDIVVRRSYGPLGTQRRIGPELSYKIHLFFTSHDGNQILQR